MGIQPPARKKWWKNSSVLLLYYSWRDPQTPWYSKLTAFSALLYIISPVDIVPDIVPFAGWLDIIAPVLISFATRMLPEAVKLVAEKKAQARKKQGKQIIISIIVILLLLIGWIVWRNYSAA